ncbi:zf-HC2 domain-containing protein [Streptomyces tricolor]|uniref:Zf-HC2 domain-containing protein n=1 Tax=Streptomyces tricolor TaxID=68277 RepID=A0ABS9JWD5_9ACTN|nr:zf-HC2 domain-containing protein [Streptomyces tricolor]MCG0069860.1 zf-HC2 domain-containing protein [Streptomyces tricolor]
MTRRARHPWHAPADLIARYAEGVLPEPDAWSLEKHVETCATCAPRVSAAVRGTAAGAVLAQMRAAVLDRVTGAETAGAEQRLTDRTTAPEAAGPQPLVSRAGAPEAAGSQQLTGRTAAPEAAGPQPLVGRAAAPETAGPQRITARAAAPETAEPQRVTSRTAAPEAAGPQPLVGRAAAPETAEPQRITTRAAAPETAGPQRLTSRAGVPAAAGPQQPTTGSDSAPAAGPVSAPAAGAVSAPVGAGAARPGSGAALRPGLPRLARLLWAAGPAVRGAWLPAVLGVAVAALALSYGAGVAGARALLLAVAPVVPVAGVALSYGPHADPLHEVAAATPGGGLRLALTRTVAVLAVSVPLLTLTGLLLPASGAPAAAAWLLPGLTLAPASLALASFVGIRVAAGVTGGGWLCAVLAPVVLAPGTAATARLAEQLSRCLDGTTAQAGWAAAATLSAALLTVRRSAYDRPLRP